MSERHDVPSVLAGADRSADLAEQGWADYIGHAPDRYAGLLTAVQVGRSIPQQLRTLKPLVTEWDAWWLDEEELHAGPDVTWLGQLRRAFEHPGIAPRAHEERDAGFSRELMRRAPRGSVSWFLQDDLGRSGWKLKLPDGTMQTVYFTVPSSVARAYAALAVTPDGRPIERVLPEYLVSMRTLIESAYERFAAPGEAVGTG